MSDNLRLTNDIFKRLLDRAHRVNRERDGTDRDSGFAAPADGRPDELLRTAYCAIECGLQTVDFRAVAQGLDMLEDLHFMLTGRLYHRQADGTYPLQK
jgi:hypothetical protein